MACRAAVRTVESMHMPRLRLPAPARTLVARLSRVRLPSKLVDNPYELPVALLAPLGCLVQLIFGHGSKAITNTLEPVLALVWAIYFAGGAALILVGLLLRTTREPLRGLGLERAGLVMGALGCLTYAGAIWLNSGPSSAIPAFGYLGFGAGMLCRLEQLRRYANDFRTAGAGDAA